ncbi:hypothetical protein [Marinicella litoralis]|uniref:Uncharacterized protein n=1 Tax=Marinicella litoralis TaxID=644220 RepID=A0A4R6XNY7_9GAMM|nr:hypothetical protein [Marinicella litoralis]TDR19457.1 hypothetical protein C8D91_2013 [Marinicella litoralis]
MTNLSIFTLVFMTQIFLLSVFYPGKLLQRMRTIQKKYPESTHPKLYPKSTNYYQKMSSFYGIINGLIFILGWVIVYYVHEGSLVSEKGINQMLPWVYFMIQMIPTWLLEIFGFRLSKLMKQEDTRKQKSATLAPRRLTEYVSPQLLSAVIITYFVFVVIAFYIEGCKFELDGKAFQMSVILLLCYAFFFGMMSWLIYGKKPDPYQSKTDRIKTITLVIKTYCYTMMACAFFMVFALAVSIHGLKSMMPVAMSLFLQFIVVISMGYMLHNNRLEDINFDVYRADSETS